MTVVNSQFAGKALYADDCREVKSSKEQDIENARRAIKRKVRKLERTIERHNDEWSERQTKVMDKAVVLIKVGLKKLEKIAEDK